MICSDGLSSMVNHQEMKDLLERQICPQAADLLAQSALKNGGRDNITAIVLDVERQGMFHFN